MEDKKRAELLSSVSPEIKANLNEELTKKMDFEDLRDYLDILANPTLQELSGVVETNSGEEWDMDAYEKRARASLPIFKRKVTNALKLLSTSK